jgi:hypothetical protein
MNPGQAHRRWLITFAVLGALAVFFYGMVADFYASAIWVVVSWWITIGAGGSLGIIWSVLFPYEPSLGMFKKCAVVLILVFSGMLISGTILTRALPDIFARIAGERFMLAQTGENGYSRIGKDWSCRLRVYAPLFETGSPDSWYCAPAAQFDALPERGEYAIHGRKTWFGHHIDRVAPAPH